MSDLTSTELIAQLHELCNDPDAAQIAHGIASAIHDALGKYDTFDLTLGPIYANLAQGAIRACRRFTLGGSHREANALFRAVGPEWESDERTRALVYSLWTIENKYLERASNWFELIDQLVALTLKTMRQELWSGIASELVEKGLGCETGLQFAALANVDAFASAEILARFDQYRDAFGDAEYELHGYSITLENGGWTLHPAVNEYLLQLEVLRTTLEAACEDDWNQFAIIWRLRTWFEPSTEALVLGPPLPAPMTHLGLATNNGTTIGSDIDTQSAAGDTHLQLEFEGLQSSSRLDGRFHVHIEDDALIVSVGVLGSRKRVEAKSLFLGALCELGQSARVVVCAHVPLFAVTGLDPHRQMMVLLLDMDVVSATA